MVHGAIDLDPKSPAALERALEQPAEDHSHSDDAYYAPSVWCSALTATRVNPQSMNTPLV